MEKPEIVKNIEQSVLNSDREHTVHLLGELYEQLKTDLVLINWIIIPVNLTGLQEIIIDNFGIPRKAMMVRNRVHDRKRRALMFTQAMKIAVSRSIDG